MILPALTPISAAVSGRPAGPCHARGQFLQFGLRGREQLLALVPALLGQLGVVASHQPFAGEVRGGDLRQAFGLQIRL